MTSITRNLPWFIRDLGVSIVGQECYTSLIENLDINDVKCIKYSISKGLGIGIVVGGSIVKVPQLLSIMNARSARGLSLPAYILETLSYVITLVYAYRNAFPFSAYGENLFLTIQNIVITVLITNYHTRSSTNGSLVFLGILASLFALTLLPLPQLAYIQLATLPLSLFSKLPQIRENYTAQSTGQLSAFAVVAQIAGCAARLFTTATEVNDPIVAAGFQLALVLNLVLGAQLWMYRGRELPAAAAGKEKEKEKEKEKVPEPVTVPVASSSASSGATAATLQHRTATPPPASLAGGRKWARKVD